MPIENWIIKKRWHYRCDECSEQDYSSGFMLKDEVWLKIASRHTVLCLTRANKAFIVECGRTLKPYDFTKAPVNRVIIEAYYMGCLSAEADGIYAL